MELQTLQINKSNINAAEYRTNLISTNQDLEINEEIDFWKFLNQQTTGKKLVNKGTFSQITTKTKSSFLTTQLYSEAKKPRKQQTTQEIIIKNEKSQTTSDFPLTTSAVQITESIPIVLKKNSMTTFKAYHQPNILRETQEAINSKLNQAKSYKMYKLSKITTMDSTTMEKQIPILSTGNTLPNSMELSDLNSTDQILTQEKQQVEMIQVPSYPTNWPASSSVQCKPVPQSKAFQLCFLELVMIQGSDILFFSEDYVPLSKILPYKNENKVFHILNRDSSFLFENCKIIINEMIQFSQIIQNPTYNEAISQRDPVCVHKLLTFAKN